MPSKSAIAHKGTVASDTVGELLDFLRPSSPADFRLTLTLSYRPLLISLPLALIYPFLSDTAPRQSIYLDTLHQIWIGIEKTVEPPT